MSLRLSLLGVTAFILALLAALPGQLSAANEVSEDRGLTGFTRIAIGGAGTAVISQGETASVTVIAPEKILAKIETTVDDTTLTIGQTPGSAISFGPDEELRYEIVVPALERLELSGAVEATLTGVEVDALDLDIQDASQLKAEGLVVSTLDMHMEGASQAELTGTAASITLEITQASTADLLGLDAQTATVTLADATTSRVRVTESISGTASNAASLEVMTEQGQVAVETTNAASVDRLTFTPLPSTPASDASGSAAAPSEVQVAIRGFAFDPAVLEIPAGTTVTWTNYDMLPHPISQLPHGSGFDSGMLAGHASYSYTFETPGVYDYYCYAHPNMVGQIIVTEP